MSLRFEHSLRLLQRPILYKHHVSRLARYTTTSSSGNNSQDSNNKAEQPTDNKTEETPVQKHIITTKAYIDKLQHDMKPRLAPYITKLNHASEQLKRLTTDVSDSKEAIQRVSRALNEITGYDQIDAVKQKVNNQGKLYSSFYFSLFSDVSSR